MTLRYKVKNRQMYEKAYIFWETMARWAVTITLRKEGKQGEGYEKERVLVRSLDGRFTGRREGKKGFIVFPYDIAFYFDSNEWLQESSANSSGTVANCY